MPSLTAPRHTASEAPVIRWVQRLIEEAHEQRASDLHLESTARGLVVRRRIDGVLEFRPGPDELDPAAIINRIKILAHLDIAQQRLPQDGRILLELENGKPLHVRVSVVPARHGPSVALRLLDPAAGAPGLSQLGLRAQDRQALEELLALPDGLLLVTGPTGAGKTTTLYACLQALNSSSRKILTVEDPVEYQLAGVNQAQVHEAAGLSFASALRAMLRQAPNIIMVGEIRDRETARIAVQAALTGHLILSTLHTNDATSAALRLVDLGVPAYLVASSLRGVLGQRLVRQLCPACGAKYRPSAQELAALGLPHEVASSSTWRRPAGCAQCRGSGFSGRLGLFELWRLDETVRQHVHTGIGPAAVRSHARACGMRTLREDGALKALAGLTTPLEVLRATMEEPA